MGVQGPARPPVFQEGRQVTPIRSYRSAPPGPRRGRPEHAIQATFVEWVELQFPKEAQHLAAIPNGGGRTKAEAGMLKAEGVKKGAPDLFLFLPRGPYLGAAFETKAPGGRQSTDQKVWQSRLQSQGYAYFLCVGVDQLMAAWRQYLAFGPSNFTGEGVE
ncbi:MAG: VRR-NUC domain-containing protein [Gammaproteobacteria bacterium]